MAVRPSNAVGRAAAWRVLHAAAGARLAPASWAALVARCGGPSDWDRLPDDASVPLGPLVAAVDDLVRETRMDATTIGRAAAHAWAGAYSDLTAQMAGRPGRLVELFVADAFPTMFVAGVPSASCTTAELYATVHLGGHFGAEFEQGLLEGVVEAAGGRAAARQAAEGPTFVLSWKLRPATKRVESRPLWTHAFRVPFLAATLVPVLAGVAVAAHDGSFRFAWALLTLAGVTFFHLGSNAFNASYELAQARREEETRVSADAEAYHRRLKRIGYAGYAAGAGIGLGLVAVRGVEILWLGLAGLLLGFLYTAPPVRLAHRGLGELAVALGFGPLIVVGTYFVQRGAWSLEALLASLPLSFLITAVLYINEFPDKEGDARVGKRTLIVRLPEKPAVVLYVVLLALTYLVIIGGVALRSLPAWSRYAFPPWTLLGLTTLPLAVRASYLVGRHYRFPYRLVSANASTTFLHLATGLLFSAGYLIGLPA